SPPLSPVSSASAAPIPPISPSARSRPADRTARIKTPLQPVWREGELLLARRIERGGGEALEGIWLHREAVRAWLLGPTRDLLPAADLRPAPNDEKADPGRQLALLPLRLDPGPQPAPEGLGGSPARLGLALATAAILAVALAAGPLIAAALRLARRRDVFVSAVTHELRTPLTTFRLYTEMLDEGLVAADRRGEYIATLRAQADRLGHLVENVLAFARLERRGAAVAAEAIPLGSLLQPIAERLSEDLKRRGLAVSLDLSPSLTSEPVHVDPIAVERILQNLADNSAKYAADGEAPRFDLAVTLERRNAILTTRDGGPGIPRAERSRLFRPFHKSAAQAATAGAPGLGLGLALSRALARGFGGDLSYVEREGGGAGFELRLPRP
ncbi:MAG TPA: HAMP domain-containing sensor histidine kinase, partial [Thermoanaerobaculia bacterium]|nr:HAMP domain-containing sensor histidine kinase [Thermoanaerobaculia bacterium]